MEEANTNSVIANVFSGLGAILLACSTLVKRKIRCCGCRWAIVLAMY